MRPGGCPRYAGIAIPPIPFRAILVLARRRYRRGEQPCARRAYRGAARAFRAPARDKRRARRSRPRSAGSHRSAARRSAPSVSVSKALSGFSRAGDSRRLGHQDQILDADAVGAGAIIAGLVGQDHAALERRAAELGDARRALRAPRDSCRRRGRCRDRNRGRRCQRNCRANESSCAPVVPSGNTARAMAIWPLSTRVKLSPHLGARRADRDGARDVGGAVLILRAGIDQKEFARRDARLVLRG